MSFEIRQRQEPDAAVRKIAAAYTDQSVAQTVVGDLVRAGMSSADITLMSPWPVDMPHDDRDRFLDHPFLVALVGAIGLGLVAATSAWLWAIPDRWLIYGVIGAVVGAITGSLASALTAASPPHWHDRLLGDSLGALTVEVSTTDDMSADVARQVMAGHAPALVQAQTEPGPKPPSERVLWHHDQGLSPLAELDSWMSSRARRRRSPRPRGRHAEPDRAR
ncbi:MAG: hypothetical protein ACRDZM_18485 [Acidimicrobiia bacterium]